MDEPYRDDDRKAAFLYTRCVWPQCNNRTKYWHCFCDKHWDILPDDMHKLTVLAFNESENVASEAIGPDDPNCTVLYQWIYQYIQNHKDSES